MADEGDIFEGVLFLEEKSYQNGYDLGYKNGLESGCRKGRVLGFEKGQEVGSEVGFYLGFVETWLNILELKSNGKTRVLISLQALRALILELRMHDPKDQKLFDGIEKLRAKFKQVCSLLGVSASYSSDAESGVSF